MNEFEEVKQAINLLDVITQETGLRMKGKHLEECPFCGGHDCFSVQARFFKCFQCSEGGDVFAFYERYLMVDKAEALNRASAFAGIKLEGEKRPKDFAAALSVKEKIFIESAEYYHSHLLTNGGMDYFINVRRHSKDVLEGMKVGWTDGGLVEHLRGKGFRDADIKAAGLAKEWEKGNGSGETLLIDYFRKGLAIFPHVNGQRVDHFTIKDPEKKLKYQLSAIARAKQWRFYNQVAFESYNEVIVVEGEHDLLSVMCAGIRHVAGLIGQVADYQIKALKSYAAYKHIYLWLDNDKAGRDFIRKICTALNGVANIRIIIYDEKYKDPDEYLKAFDGDKRKEVKRLQLEAVDYLTWELAEIAKLEDLDNKLNALKERKIFAAVAEMVQSEKEVFIEKIERLGLSKQAIGEEIEFNQPLLSTINNYLGELKNQKDANPKQLAMDTFNYFAKNGRVYRDRFHNVFIWYRHETVEVGMNRPFNSLMLRLTGLDPSRMPGRSVWEILASLCYNSGKQIDIASWIHTERETDTIYVNLNSPNSTILKISKCFIEEISNVLNKDDVLLKSSEDILPVNYLPDTGIDEGMQVFKKLIFDSLTCEMEQRYLIICWIVSAFLIDFTPYIAVMKFSGSKGSGKTTAARAVSYLVFGLDNVEEQTTSAAYSTASQNPLVIMDNLEAADRSKSKSQFILHSASRVGKRKRAAGTESGTTKEKPKSLILITAIEPFTRGEEIDRIYDLDFSKNNKSDDFVEDENIGAIKKKRNLMLSAILKFIQKDILPDLSRRKEYMVILKKEYKGHAKDRTDEYLAILMLILEKVLKYIPFYKTTDLLWGVESGASEIWNAWITYQDAKAKDTETTSNSIVSLLDGIVREYLVKMKDSQEDHTVGLKGFQNEYYKNYDEKDFTYTHPEYLLEIFKTRNEIINEEGNEPYTRTFIEFMATAGDIVYAFNRFCKNNGTRNPYTSGSILAARLRNDINVLKNAGWETVDRPGFEPYYTRKHGLTYWKLRKVIIR